jgi:hypothetical protein
VSDLGWRADGIARALAVGGVELERYRRPGFAGGEAVRVVSYGVNAEGFDYEADPWPGDELSRVSSARLRRDHRRRPVP